MSSPPPVAGFAHVAAVVALLLEREAEDGVSAVRFQEEASAARPMVLA